MYTDIQVFTCTLIDLLLCSSVFDLFCARCFGFKFKSSSSTLETLAFHLTRLHITDYVTNILTMMIAMPSSGLLIEWRDTKNWFEQTLIQLGDYRLLFFARGWLLSLGGLYGIELLLPANLPIWRSVLCIIPDTSMCSSWRLLQATNCIACWALGVHQVFKKVVQTCSGQKSTYSRDPVPLFWWHSLLRLEILVRCLAAGIWS